MKALLSVFLLCLSAVLVGCTTYPGMPQSSLVQVSDSPKYNGFEVGKIGGFGYLFRGYRNVPVWEIELASRNQNGEKVFVVAVMDHRSDDKLPRSQRIDEGDTVLVVKLYSPEPVFQGCYEALIIEKIK